MRDFTRCPECQKEYDNPLSRRFHAQPNVCPRCGPALGLVDAIMDFVGPLGRLTEVEPSGTLLCVGGGVGVASTPRHERSR
jgi:hypothetical protein